MKFVRYGVIGDYAVYKDDKPTGLEICKLPNRKWEVVDYTAREQEDAEIAIFNTLKEAKAWCINYFKEENENV